MIQTRDISSLTDFKRNTPAHLRELKKTGRPRVLTINGRAAVVVQDAGAFDRLVAALDRLEAVEGIREGLDQFERGEGLPVREAVARARDRVARSRRSA